MNRRIRKVVRRRQWRDLVRVTFSQADLEEAAKALLESKSDPAVNDMFTARAHVFSATQGEVWRNDKYQVIVTRQQIDAGLPTCIHLSIKRLDKATAHEWGDFQRIKDQLVGPDKEAVELYPHAGRVLDSTNQYHLWAFDSSDFVFPFGFSGDNPETP